MRALATSGAAAIRIYRSDRRALAIRKALSNALFAAGRIVTAIQLDKAKDIANAASSSNIAALKLAAAAGSK